MQVSQAPFLWKTGQVTPPLPCILCSVWLLQSITSPCPDELSPSLQSSLAYKAHSCQAGTNSEQIKAIIIAFARPSILRVLSSYFCRLRKMHSPIGGGEFLTVQFPGMFFYNCYGLNVSPQKACVGNNLQCNRVAGVSNGRCLGMKAMHSCVDL